MKCLHLHPQVYFKAKPRFFNFDEEYAKGTAYYAGFFEDAASQQVVGEGDEHYLSGEARFATPSVIAQRIHDVVPEARILICIRNQVDFLLSGYRYWKRSGITASFDEFMDGWPKEGVAFAAIADFQPLIQQYIELFGADQVHVVLHEEFSADNAAFLRDLFSWLQVDTEPVADILSQTSVYTDVNPSPSSWLARALGVANSYRMRNPGLYRWIFPVRAYRAITVLEYRLFGSRAQESRRLLTDEQRQAIATRYAPGNRRLSELLGIDLGAHGYPV